MSYSYTAGPRGEKWESFTFVSSGKKGTNVHDLALLFSKLEYDLFENGSEWAGSWEDVAKSIKSKCNANQSKVGYLRLSCHGNDGVFVMGKSIFAISNMDKWTPHVAQIAGYFVPGVSFITIDACRVGRDDQILTGFSNALGGVDVRGYEELQSAFNNSAENGRGAAVTCRVNICTRHEAIQ